MQTLSGHFSETADSILSDSLSINKNTVILTPTSNPTSLPFKTQPDFKLINQSKIYKIKHMHASETIND